MGRNAYYSPNVATGTDMATLLARITAARSTLWDRLDALDALLADGDISVARVGALDRLDIVLSTLRGQAAAYFNIASTAQPGAATVYDDTGALAAGEYELDLKGLTNIRDVNGWSVDLEHRNAANAANVRAIRLVVAAQEVLNTVRAFEMRWLRFTVAAGERVRLVNGAGVASTSAFTSVASSLFVRKCYG